MVESSLVWLWRLGAPSSRSLESLLSSKAEFPPKQFDFFDSCLQGHRQGSKMNSEPNKRQSKDVTLLVMGDFGVLHSTLSVYGDLNGMEARKTGQSHDFELELVATH